MNMLDKMRSKWYDLIHNVDTRAIVPLAKLDVVGQNKSLGYMYFPTLPKSMHALFGRLKDLDPLTTFIDVGCGKGIALLVASCYPFKKIVGVEFSRELCRIANQNLANYRGTRSSKNVDVLCMDATEYTFPDGNLLVYFYNPFDKPVMEKVLKNLTVSLAREKREVTVICDRLHDRELVTNYLHPQKCDIFLGFSIYSQLKPAISDIRMA